MMFCFCNFLYFILVHIERSSQSVSKYSGAQTAAVGVAVIVTFNLSESFHGRMNKLPVSSSRTGHKTVQKVFL